MGKNLIKFRFYLEFFMNLVVVTYYWAQSLQPSCLDCSLLVGQVSMIHITVLSLPKRQSTQFGLNTNLFFPVDFELNFKFLAGEPSRCCIIFIFKFICHLGIIEEHMGAGGTVVSAVAPQ